MSYEPMPGSTAFRVIAHLQSLPKGAELMTSALAEAIGCEGKNIVPSIEAALANGLIFRRQRDTHARSPMWWSLTDHGARPKVDIRQPAVPVAEKDAPQEGANRDASAGQSHDAAGSASPAGRGTNGASARGAAPVFIPPEPGPQQVLKAEPATADATDRGAPDIASPRVGAMGAGQAADAAPAVVHGFVQPESTAGKLRIALWNDGALQIYRQGGGLNVLLNPDETRALVAYLERLAA